MNAPARAVAPASALRRGACPALSAPMPTGDGLLVRLNLTEGGLAPATLVALCEAAQAHGNGLVEITARGSFQVRGLTPASAPLFADAVNALAIPVRDGVPVETSPLAGLDLQEIAEPFPLVRAVREAIAATGLTPRLGPKVSVVVDGGGQIGLASVAADVRVAAMSGQEWAVSVADKQLAVAQSEKEAVAAVIALLGGIAAMGPSARGRDLPAAALIDANRLGIRSTLPPSVLPDISPLSGEMSARTEGGAKGRIRLGLIPLRNDLCALAIALPFGQCEAAELAQLAKNAPAIADFRFAPGRRLLALGPRDACLRLQAAAAELAFVTDPADPRLSINACAGASACASGHIPARALAAEVAALLPPGFAGTIHISGCAKGCAHPALATLVLFGAGDGIALLGNGRAGDQPQSRHPDSRSALAALATELQKTAA
jgi:precorrin-3B synthase